MNLTSVAIKNFKGLKNAVYNPSRFGCIVGENNAGKSTVLQAIVYALNRPNKLDAGLFYNTAEPIEFKITIDGVDQGHLGRLEEKHRDRIAPLISDGRFILIARYAVDEKVEIKVESLVPFEEWFQTNSLSVNFRNLRGNAVTDKLEEVYREFADEAPQGLTAAQAKAFISEKVTQLPREAFILQEGPLPTGISTSISKLLPEPIYIPAVKNLADNLKTSQTTSFERLLGLLLEDMPPDLVDITNALSGLNTFFNRVDVDESLVDERHEKVRELETSIESLLEENFPAVEIELSVPPPELHTILNSAQLFVDDGSKDSVENKGDGIKRLLTFALLQSYVNKLSEQVPTEGEEPKISRPIIFCSRSQSFIFIQNRKKSFLRHWKRFRSDIKSLSQLTRRYFLHLG